MAMRQVIHVLSAVEKSLAFEWLFPRLAREYDLKVILLNPGVSSMETFLREQGIPVERITLRGKMDFLPSFLRLLIIFLFRRPDVVHVHLFDAQRLALPAAWLARIRRRIYTRHNSTLHHRYYPSGIKFDRWSNGFATDIVSVSQATDYALLELEGVSGSKVTRIPHGFDFQVFGQVTTRRVEALRKKWNIPMGRPVIGLVSRLIEWKGLQYALPALAAFQRNHPEAIVILANANGPYQRSVDKLLTDFVPGSVVCIPFEEDILALYRLFDLLVHTPIDPYVEAFGQVYVEAMASGIPVVGTPSGVAGEIMVSGKNGILVPFCDSQSVAAALEDLWKKPDFRQTLALNAQADVLSRFPIDTMVAALKKLYNA